MLRRRFRFFSPVLNVFLLTVSVYLVLIGLLATNSFTYDEPKTRKLWHRTTNNEDVTTNRTRRLTAVKDLRLAIKSHDFRTTEGVTDSSPPPSSNGKNVTDEGLATGYERVVRTFRSGFSTAK